MRIYILMAMACLTALVAVYVHEEREDKRVTRQLNLVEWHDPK